MQSHAFFQEGCRGRSDTHREGYVKQRQRLGDVAKNQGMQADPRN